MASGSGSSIIPTVPLVPDFLKFLFSDIPKFDCYFKVGKKNQGKPVRIGAVKLMLMAHSQVFRRQLEDSDLIEKGDVPVTDVHPDTFKGMLKYVYGHDTTSDLCFNEADSLFYVAVKYMMKPLKEKLAVRLMKLLTPDNICTLLNNPACYTHLELNSAIMQILRFETDRVLASPQLVLMNPDGFLKILEQDGLAVPEIELWRAAIKWAKHRADSEDGQLLRQQLSGFTQHLRLCTLTGDEICGEVATSDVLTRDEIGAVCQSVGRKRKAEGLTEICDEIVPRKRLNRASEFELTKFEKNDVQKEVDYSFTLSTKQCAVELLPLVCLSRDRNSADPENSTYKVECNITITKGVDRRCYFDPDEDSPAKDPPTTVTFSENVKCGVEFDIPLAVDGRNVILLPDTEYTVDIKMRGHHTWYLSKGHSSTCFRDDHLTMDIGYMRSSDFTYYYYFPSSKFHYRVLHHRRSSKEAQLRE